eukprot:2574649-Alexandrium_andersonii.AAC.1
MGGERKPTIVKILGPAGAPRFAWRVRRLVRQPANSDQRVWWALLCLIFVSHPFAYRGVSIYRALWAASSGPRSDVRGLQRCGTGLSRPVLRWVGAVPLSEPGSYDIKASGTTGR